MINDNIKAMLNEQLAKEFFSSYFYLAIANYYEGENLDGFANWFEVQAKEELDHALLFRKYLINDGYRINFGVISAPVIAYKSLDEALSAALAHEQMITLSICNIYSEALEKKDYRVTQFLDWFMKEQGEEEKSSMDLLKKFELFGSDTKGLYMLNAELLGRVYAAPSLVLS